MLSADDVKAIAQQVIAYLTAGRELTPEEIAERDRRDAELRAETAAAEQRKADRLAWVAAEMDRRLRSEPAPPPDVAHIAVTMADGTLQVMQFITRQQRYGDDPGWTREVTVENVTNEIQRALVPLALEGHFAMPKSWRVIDRQHLPTDRTFRNAWRDTGTAIEHHMPHVREIALGRVRAARVTRLERADREWMRAAAQFRQDEAAAAERERQRLRDLPAMLAPHLEAAQTPEDVLALIAPEIG